MIIRDNEKRLQSSVTLNMLHVRLRGLRLRAEKAVGGENIQRGEEKNQLSKKIEAQKEKLLE